MPIVSPALVPSLTIDSCKQTANQAWGAIWLSPSPLPIRAPVCSALILPRQAEANFEFGQETTVSLSLPLLFLRRTGRDSIRSRNWQHHRRRSRRRHHRRSATKDRLAED